MRQTMAADHYADIVRTQQVEMPGLSLAENKNLRMLLKCMPYLTCGPEIPQYIFFIPPSDPHTGHPAYRFT
jgi:hypothetical protein